MKRSSLLLIMLLLSLVNAHSQIFRERAKRSYIGFRAGYSIATWSGLAYVFPETQVKTIPGYHGGVFISVLAAKHVTVEPGIQYSVKGWLLEGTIDDGFNVVEGTITNQISYIDAPLMCRIFIKGLNFGFGPQVSLPLKSKLDFEGEVNGVPGSSSYTNTVDLNDLDVALVLSTGYEFAFGLSFHATYDIGLSEAAALYPYPEQFPFWTEASNRVVKLSVAFKIW